MKIINKTKFVIEVEEVDNSYAGHGCPCESCCFIADGCCIAEVIFGLVCDESYYKITSAVEVDAEGEK